MTQPTESELLILNAIIYTDDFANQAENMTIYEWAVQFDINCLNGGKKPAEMSKVEFQRIINTIKSNQTVYQNMTVRNINNEQYANESGSQRITNAAISYNDDLIVLFKGTGGDLEWRDNGIGGYSSITDTEQQKKALDYFDQVTAQHGGNSIYVTGHSKGGNKAQYVGVLRGRQIEHVYSFDGQGFNQGFLLKYKEQIEENRMKLTNISNEFDFVNILLTPIAEDRRYIHSSTNWGIKDSSSFVLSSGENKAIQELMKEGSGYGKAMLEWLKHVGGNAVTHKAGAWHSPYSMFAVTKEDTLLLNKAVDQSDATGELQKLLIYYNKYMKEEDWRFLCYSVMSAVQSGDKPYGEDFSEMPVGFVGRLTSLTAGYTQKHKEISSTDIFMFLHSALGLNIGSLFTGGLVGLGYAKVAGTGYTDQLRDFSQNTKDQLLAIVSEVEDEPFWDIRKWAVFYRIDQYLLNGVDFPGNSRELSEYYRKIIDIQGISAKEIQRIFDEIYEAEANFTKEMESVKNEAKKMYSILKEISEKFV